MNDQNQIQQGFMTPDGKVFATRSEAQDYLRKPQIMEALGKVTGKNAELDAWLFEKREEVADTFESTKIRRVTKSERKALEKALEAVKASGEKAFNFLVEYSDAILNSFRHESVKRGTEEEQAATIRQGFIKLTDNNEELSDWIIANQEALLAAFEAGVTKRPVNEAASAALAEYQAAKKAGPEALAAYKQKKDAEKAAKEKAASVVTA